MFKRHISIIISSLVLLTGCASIGPKQIDIDREAYNDIVRETDYEQILKNIVRLRYAEPTSYLKVTSVTASYQFTRSISATVTGQAMGSGNNAVNPSINTGTLGVTPSTSYSDAPTISYVPINDATFVAALQQPVDFHDLALLVNGGISDDELIMRLVFDWVGGLDNASSAANARVKQIPQYQEYYTYVQLMLKMIKTRQLYIDPVEISHSKAGVIIDFTKNNYQSPEALQIKKMLDIPASSKDIIMTNQNIYNLRMGKTGFIEEENSQDLAKNLVFVQMRSLNAMMAFLSHAVQVPEADVKAGYVPELKDSNGNNYDWSPLMNGLMEIKTSESEPVGAFVKTKVNGHWFYISKSDIDSKATFALLVRLMNMKAGLGVNNSQTSPVITVPVGAR